MLSLYLQKREENVKNNTLITNKKPKNDIFTVYLGTDYKVDEKDLKFCIVIFNKRMSVCCKTWSFATLIALDSCFFLTMETRWSVLSKDRPMVIVKPHIIWYHLQITCTPQTFQCVYLRQNLPMVDLVIFRQLSN